MGAKTVSFIHYALPYSVKYSTDIFPVLNGTLYTKNETLELSQIFKSCWAELMNEPRTRSTEKIIKGLHKSCQLDVTRSAISVTHQFATVTTLLLPTCVSYVF